MSISKVSMCNVSLLMMFTLPSAAASCRLVVRILRLPLAVISKVEDPASPSIDALSNFECCCATRLAVRRRYLRLLDTTEPCSVEFAPSSSEKEDAHATSGRFWDVETCSTSA